MQIMDYLDNMEEEYHKSYPDDPCPMDGGYKASFERFVIESLRAEWGMLNFPTLISLISRIFYSFGVFTESQNENPRCLQRRKIREIREIRVRLKRIILSVEHESFETKQLIRVIRAIRVPKKNT